MPATSEGKPTGSQKSAILLLAMGEEAAVQVLAQLGDQEISDIGHAASTLGELDPASAQEVLDEFSEMISTTLTLRDSNDYVYRLSVKAFGEDKATKLLRDPDQQAMFKERLSRGE